MIKKFIKWLSGKSLKQDPLDEDYTDEFRIKLIELKSGLCKYYPEYKSGVMSSWAQLILFNNKGVGNIFLDHNELLESKIAYCDSEEEATEIIEKYKEQLTKDREHEFFEEDIIEI